MNTCNYTIITKYVTYNYTYNYTSIHLYTTKPLHDNNFSLKLCKFEGNLVEVIVFWYLIL